MERDYDVVVVGGGGAGLSAALVAHEAGARVIIAESQPVLGGSTRVSGGVFYAAGTSVQRAAGITDDTPDAMFDYYMTLNQWRVEPALARRLCDLAAPTLEWLIELGVTFPPEQIYSSGVEGVARGHGPSMFGFELATVLENKVTQAGIDIALANRVDELLMEDGQVVGVSANGERVTAGAVVITTGGFGQNPALLEQHYPEATAAGDWTWSISAPGCVGDGLALGEQAGAAIVGHNRGLLLATPGFSKLLEVDPPGWLVYLNKEGRRFVDESAPYAVMSGAIKEQGGSAFAIFDEPSRAAAAPDAKYGDAFGAGIVAVNFVADTLKEMTDAGKVITATSLSELAAKASINPEAMCSTVERYNADCATGSDRGFFKDSHYLQTIQTPPFYAVEMRPAIVCLTSTGLRIDPDARVMSTAERPIPGLFAAGETTGGVLGDRYIGGGNSIANAIVFGRVAGESAAAYAKSVA